MYVNNFFVKKIVEVRDESYNQGLFSISSLIFRSYLVLIEAIFQQNCNGPCYFQIKSILKGRNCGAYNHLTAATDTKINFDPFPNDKKKYQILDREMSKSQTQYEQD